MSISVCNKRKLFLIDFQLMIPGRDTCPPHWKKEYTGYIMAEYNGHKHSKPYLCVDDTPQVIHYKIDSALNDTCRRITGCLKPTPLTRCKAGQESTPPPSILRDVSSQSERQKCNLDQRHPMYGLTAEFRTVPPLDKHTTHQLKRQNLWQNYTDHISDQHKLQNFPVQESLPQDTSYNGINGVVSTV